MVLAASLIASESGDSFAWVFTHYLRAFRYAPAVIFTDSDPGMAAAASAILCVLGTLHFLCIWHLSKNLLTHIKPALFSALSSFDTFIAGWWTICMCSDSSSVTKFSEEWDTLLAPLRAGPPSPARTAALEWLDSLAERREKWAARFTWQTLTLGIHSTQRGEAVHSAIDRFCSASMLLTTLLQRLDEYGAGVEVRSETRDVLRSLRLVARESTGAVPPILSSAARLVTPYAVQLMSAQWQQSLHYGVSPVANGDAASAAAATFRVARIAGSARRPVAEEAADYGDGVGGSSAFSIARTTTLEACSCQFPSSTGVPCRHQLAVASQLQVHDAGMLRLAPQWRLVSEAQRSELVRAMLSTPPPSLSALPAPGQTMLKTDRFA